MTTMTSRSGNVSVLTHNVRDFKILVLYIFKCKLTLSKCMQVATCIYQVHTSFNFCYYMLMLLFLAFIDF